MFAGPVETILAPVWRRLDLASVLQGVCKDWTQLLTTPTLFLSSGPEPDLLECRPVTGGDGGLLGACMSRREELAGLSGVGRHDLGSF